MSPVCVARDNKLFNLATDHDASRNKLVVTAWLPTKFHSCWLFPSGSNYFSECICTVQELTMYNSNILHSIRQLSSWRPLIPGRLWVQTPFRYHENKLKNLLQTMFNAQDFRLGFTEYSNTSVYLLALRELTVKHNPYTIVLITNATSTIKHIHKLS